MISFLGAWVATDRSRHLAALVVLTFKRMNLNRKEIEGYTGLTEKQQSDQLTLKQPLNLWRLAEIPGFLRVFLDVLAEDQECLVFHKHIVKAILMVEASPKPMLKVLPHEGKKAGAA